MTRALTVERSKLQRAVTQEDFEMNLVPSAAAETAQNGVTFHFLESDGSLFTRFWTYGVLVLPSGSPAMILNYLHEFRLARCISRIAGDWASSTPSADT